MATKNRVTAQKFRAWYLKATYGMTEQDFNALLAKQRGLCAVCFTSIEGRGKRRGSKEGQLLAHIDHCHASGRVRGLLCLNCNTAAGLLKDSAAIAERMAAYLDA